MNNNITIPETEEELLVLALELQGAKPQDFYQLIRMQMAKRFPRMAYKKIYFRTRKVQAAICRLMRKKFPGSVRTTFEGAGPPVITIAGVKFMYTE